MNVPDLGGVNSAMNESAGTAGAAAPGHLFLVLDEIDQDVVAQRLGRREERTAAVDFRIPLREQHRFHAIFVSRRCPVGWVEEVWSLHPFPALIRR